MLQHDRKAARDAFATWARELYGGAHILQLVASAELWSADLNSQVDAMQFGVPEDRSSSTCDFQAPLTSVLQLPVAVIGNMRVCGVYGVVALHDDTDRDDELGRNTLYVSDAHGEWMPTNYTVRQMCEDSDVMINVALQHKTCRLLPSEQLQRAEPQQDSLRRQTRVAAWLTERSRKEIERHPQFAFVPGYFEREVQGAFPSLDMVALLLREDASESADVNVQEFACRFPVMTQEMMFALRRLLPLETLMRTQEAEMRRLKLLLHHIVAGEVV